MQKQIHKLQNEIILYQQNEQNLQNQISLCERTIRKNKITITKLASEEEDETSKERKERIIKVYMKRI